MTAASAHETAPQHASLRTLEQRYHFRPTLQRVEIVSRPLLHRLPPAS